MKKGVLFDVIYNSVMHGVVYINNNDFLVVNYETNHCYWIPATSCMYCNSKEKVVD